MYLICVLLASQLLMLISIISVTAGGSIAPYLIIYAKCVHFGRMYVLSLPLIFKFTIMYQDNSEVFLAGQGTPNINQPNPIGLMGSAGAGGPGIGAAIVNGLFQLGTTAYNTYQQKQINKANYQHDVDMANMSYKLNEDAALNAYNRSIAMWQMEQNYNTPLAQRQRMIDAGINPAIAFGGTQTTSGNASGARNSPQGGASTTATAGRAPQIDPQAALTMAQTTKTLAEAGQIKEQTKKTGVEITDIVGRLYMDQNTRFLADSLTQLSIDLQTIEKEFWHSNASYRNNILSNESEISKNNSEASGYKKDQAKEEWSQSQTQTSIQKTTIKRG